ncbi:hypothetical protein ADUPG1_002567, partial [Aduncisulcus paluster]
VSLIPVAGNMDDLRIVNPHTFISVTTSIQQIYTITAALAEIDPDNADFYKKMVERLRPSGYCGNRTQPRS